MKIEFDTLWGTKNETPCPLSDQQLESMIAHAKEQHLEREQITINHKTTSTNRWVVSLAVAAGLAILIIPIKLMDAHAASPSQIDYRGQQVKFICNNRCDAVSVIESLDAFIKKS